MVSIDKGMLIVDAISNRETLYRQELKSGGLLRTPNAKESGKGRDSTWKLLELLKECKYIEEEPLAVRKKKLDLDSLHCTGKKQPSTASEPRGNSRQSDSK
jgi:hypothetical protein